MSPEKNKSFRRLPIHSAREDDYLFHQVCGLIELSAHLRAVIMTQECKLNVSYIAPIVKNCNKSGALAYYA
jgi:hypothetical protein